MRILLLFLFILLNLFSSGQMPMNLQQELPIDSAISTGKLENGMTYYIRSNSTPKNRADMFLVVRAGSVDEDDDQQGLAHFCEHMAFNGTKNFPKNELTSYLESLGMEFGPEINAYTYFDETVYMIKVPLDSTEYVQTGLQVLYDWACQVSFFDEDIETERGIIREEWRAGRGAEERMLQKWLPSFFYQSKYAQRLPIGQIETIDKAPAGKLRRFYHDWYRPDLQAVIVVGDFNRDEMVEQVQKMFSKIPTPQSVREKEYFDIPSHTETQLSIVSDPEAQYPIAQVYYKHPMKIVRTIGDYRELLIRQLYNSMICQRLSELTQAENPPFIFGESSIGELVGPILVYASMAVCQNGKIEEGLRAVLTENERVKKHGFTNSELERQKSSMLKSIEKLYIERNQQQSINYAEEYKRNFLHTQEPIPGITNEYNYYKNLLPNIQLDEVNALAQKWITNENRVVIITAPETEGIELPDSSRIMQLLLDVQKSTPQAYSDNIDNSSLLNALPTPGEAIFEKLIPEVDAHEYTLSNGAKVIIKTTDFKDDEIMFTAYSPGGYSMYGQEDDISAKLAPTILSTSGIAGFDPITLDKMLADKVFSLKPYLSDIYEGFSGSSSVNDAETLLQLIHLYFTQQRTDSTSFASYINRMKGTLENKKASPEAAFKDTLEVTRANNHPRQRPFNTEILNEAKLDRITAINLERFSNARDFTFFFVGNIDINTFLPLIEQYIGSLPSVGTTEQWKNMNINAPRGIIEKTVYKGQESKSLHYISFHGEFEFTKENIMALTVLGKILSTRLLEVIREDKGSVYSIDASPSASKYPDTEYSMNIWYGCAPEKIKELQQAIFNEIRQIMEKGPSNDELKKAKEKLLREREVNLRENKFWQAILSSYYRNYDGDFSDFNLYNDLVNSTTNETIKQACIRFIDFNNYLSVSLKPESARP